MERPALITTVHDPEGRFLRFAQKSERALADYSATYFRATPTTDRRLLRLLDRRGNVSVGEANQIGRSRREVLRQARTDGAGALFYCDFDRWLHWAACHPHELLGLPQTIGHDQSDKWYVCLGRTARAFATHPRVQRQTEDISNRVISLLTGQELDATAGACWMNAPAADMILSDSVVESNATDLEWPALIATRNRELLGCLALEGLEFETATFYEREIRAAGGRVAWLADTYDRSGIWDSRLQLMTASVRAAMRVFDAAAMNALSCE